MSSEGPSSVALQFCWGTKRGVGGSKRDIRFYESFTYDNVNYSLYDCVYFFKKDEQQAYIGKILKIWEQQGQKKKVKILWFFRRDDILNYLEDHTTLENEIFLASGEGVGLTNINPLEAIAGKCSVICTSTDERNSQPSKYALEMADYIFYRTFDVGNYTISDRIPDNIAGVELKFLLNRKEDQNPIPVSIPEANGTDKDVKTDILQSVSLVALESKIKIDELGCTPSSETKDDVNEGKHPNNGTPLFGQKNVPNSKSNSIDEVQETNKTAVPHDEEMIKSAKNKSPSNVSSDNPTKRMKLSDDSVKQSENLLPDKNVTGAKTLKISSGDVDSIGNSVQLHRESSNKNKLNEKKIKPSEESLQKLSPVSVENDIEANHLTLEVPRRPDPDRSKWFKGLPWEGRMRNANEQGTLVFLENLDRSITATDLEDIMHHMFKQNCTVKIMAESTFHNPHYGQAYVIFKTRDAADTVVQQINTSCLMLPNGRPLIASRGLLKMPPKSSVFPGHLTIDKIKFQMQREEMRRAVSTSHCSQPNTIEYEMAMDWVLTQEKSIKCLRRLFQGHGDEVNHLRMSLKTKAVNGQGCLLHDDSKVRGLMRK